MFKKAERLDRREFTEYFKKGRRQHFPHLTIIVSNSSKNKAAVVVGKKVAKSAVRRNLLRRRVSAVLKELLDTSVSTQVMIVVLKPTFGSLTKEKSREEVTKAIAQVIKGA